MAERLPTRRRAGRKPPIDLTPIPYRLTRVRLGDQGGEAVLARLRALVESGVPGARRTAWTWHYCR